MLKVKNSTNKEGAASDRLKQEALNEVASEGTKRLNAEIPVSLHREFKKASVDEDGGMSEVLRRLIQGYVESRR